MSETLTPSLEKLPQNMSTQELEEARQATIARLREKPDSDDGSTYETDPYIKEFNRRDRIKSEKAQVRIDVGEGDNSYKRAVERTEAATDGQIADYEKSIETAKTAFGIGEKALRMAGEELISPNLQHDMNGYDNAVLKNGNDGRTDAEIAHSSARSTKFSHIAPGSEIITRREVFNGDAGTGVTEISRIDAKTGETLYKTVTGIPEIGTKVNKLAAREVVNAASKDVAAAAEAFQREVQKTEDS